MKDFIFSATNKDGKQVTERIEAENLSQARYTLECRGYEAIAFHTSEINGDVDQTFDAQTQRRIKKANAGLMKAAGRGGALYTIWMSFRYLWHFWLSILACILLVCWVMRVSLVWSLAPLSIVFVLMLFSQIPSIFFNELTKAANMADWPKVRRWAGIISIINKISFVKIPAFWLDMRLACADAAEGNMPAALSRLNKYENDQSVAKAFYYTGHAGIYAVANDKTKLMEYRKLAMEHSQNRAEETLDYAVGLVRYRGQAGEARTLIDRVYEGELTELNEGLALFALGVVECEDKNYERAGFYFDRAESQLLANANPDLLGSLLSAMKAYSVLIYSNLGNYQKAEECFLESRQYLIAHKETELLERCENALR